MTVLALLQSRLYREMPQIPARITRFTPAPVMERFLTAAVNHLLKQEREQGDLDFLQGQIAKVEIIDLNFDFSLTLNGPKLEIKVPAIKADATLRSDQASMLQILHGEVDPDTLFFRRKLLITGDTELGLYIKNLIDTIDLTQRIPKPVMSFLTQIHQLTQDGY